MFPLRKLARALTATGAMAIASAIFPPSGA